LGQSHSDLPFAVKVSKFCPSEMLVLLTFDYSRFKRCLNELNRANGKSSESLHKVGDYRTAMPTGTPLQNSTQEFFAENALLMQRLGNPIYAGEGDE
jgi:hypothetical protein